LLGDFEINDYRESPGMLAIFFIFTSIALIILLNVIIAVISDSFERASIGSDLIFGKARIEFVAQNEALESFLRPKSSLVEHFEDVRGVGRQSLVLAMRFVRWSAFIFMVAAATLSDVFLYGRIHVSGSDLISDGTISESWVSLIVTILFFLTLTVALWVLFRMALLELFENCSPVFADKWFGAHGWSKSVTRKIASIIFGLEVYKVNARNGGEDSDEWSGRVAYLEKAMERMILNATQNLADDMSAMERRLNEKLEVQ